jgi:hypothetical protein
MILIIFNILPIICFLSIFLLIGILWILFEKSKPFWYKNKLIEVEELFERSTDYQNCFEQIMELQRFSAKADQLEIIALLDKWTYKYRQLEIKTSDNTIMTYYGKIIDIGDRIIKFVDNEGYEYEINLNQKYDNWITFLRYQGINRI